MIRESKGKVRDGETPGPLAPRHSNRPWFCHGSMVSTPPSEKSRFLSYSRPNFASAYFARHFFFAFFFALFLFSHPIPKPHANTYTRNVLNPFPHPPRHCFLLRPVRKTSSPERPSRPFECYFRCYRYRCCYPPPQKKNEITYNHA